MINCDAWIDIRINDTACTDSPFISGVGVFKYTIYRMLHFRVLSEANSPIQYRLGHMWSILNLLQKCSHSSRIHYCDDYARRVCGSRFVILSSRIITNLLPLDLARACYQQVKQLVGYIYAEYIVLYEIFRVSVMTVVVRERPFQSTIITFRRFSKLKM